MLNGILSEDVGAVVVFYNPDRACIERANRIANLCRCIVVDNTPADAYSPDVERALDVRIGYLANARNVGIATALNQGLERLIAEGRKYALLFDQDSEPTETLVSELVRAMSECVARHEPVAVVGPAYEDPRLRGVAPFVRFGYFRLKRIAPLGDVPIDVDFLITSGSCVNLGCWVTSAAWTIRYSSISSTPSGAYVRGHVVIAWSAYRGSKCSTSWAKSRFVRWGVVIRCTTPCVTTICFATPWHC